MQFESYEKLLFFFLAKICLWNKEHFHFKLNIFRVVFLRKIFNFNLKIYFFPLMFLLILIMRERERGG